MKTLINSLYFILTITFLFSCGKKQTDTTSQPVDSVSTSKPTVLQVKIDARTIGPEKSDEQLEIEKAIEQMMINKDVPMVGYWVGPFGKNKINIAIAGAVDGKATGYTVCAGNYRPITGSMTGQGDSLLVFDMNEPGTDQYDGHFQFTINTSRNEMKGSWVPFKKGAASSKQFLLRKTSYEYKTDVGEYPQASSRLLEDSDVSNLLEEELELMRNEIYARHGYSFKDKVMRQYFDTTSWYIPMGIDIRDDLTDIEVENIDKIYLYEEYLAENYDDFGR